MTTHESEAELLCDQGASFLGVMDIKPALDSYRRAHALAPNLERARRGLADAVVAVAASALSAGERDEAIRLYERALALAPAHPGALYNLGVAWMHAGELDRAALFFALAAERDPGCAEALNNLGILEQQRGDLVRAAHHFEHAAAARADLAEPRNNLALVAIALGAADEAITHARAALAIDPCNAQAQNNLGVALLDLGAPDEAQAAFDAALALDADERSAAHNRLLAMNYTRHGDDASVAEAHRAWADDFGRRHPALPPLTPEELDRRARDPDRPLVVGYVSPDLFAHSVSYFAAAPLTHHDPERVRAIVYSCVGEADGETERLRTLVEARGHRWFDVAHLPEPALAETVRIHEVDLLVELSGHTGGNRLACFAMKPAPLQLTWLGYPNTTGLAAIDYFVTDDICVPHDVRQSFAEEPLRLPGCFCAYTPPVDAPPVAPAPVVANGYVTFGSFNNLSKMGPDVLCTWARILASVERSRLLLKARAFASPVARARVLARLQTYGIDAARVELIARTPTRAAHLASYARVDISLDPWPYAGATTTCESLLMGVPCVVLRGRGCAQNVGASLITVAGLADEWIAADPDEYVHLAVRAAAAPRVLREQRARLRAQLLRSPLCDGAGFVARLESAYRTVWRRWCERR